MSLLQVRSKNTLRLLLYSGIALVVVSMLFLGRGFETYSFLLQAAVVMAAPAFFYTVGGLVCRHLDAPLAGPGLVAAGAWLAGVGLINLYEKRVLLPEAIQPYYWLFASILGCIWITLTGHRVRVWLMVPPVLLAQLNLVWTLMSFSGLDVTWWSALSFVMVLVWWEVRLEDAYWSGAYRVGAVLLALFLLFFSFWLNAPTPEAVVSTWAAGAVVVTLLGLRHGWINAGPLVIIMMAYASAWALPAAWWPLAWMALAVVTIVFIELMSACGAATEISVGLAVVLAGLAALVAEVAPFFRVPVPPPVAVAALAGAGAVLAWLGWRRAMRIAAHVGVWLLASAWSEIYFFLFGMEGSGAYGLWLALAAVTALLVSTFKTTQQTLTLQHTVMRWPLADLALGLSLVTVIWVALNLAAAPLLVLAATLAVVVGVWAAAGLIYRLPVLLHLAAWMAPLPYALVLVLVVPALRSLPALGLMWQLLGLAFVLLGHSLRQHSEAVRLPFFAVGYGLLGVGFTLAMGSEALLPASLALVVLVSLATAVVVLAGWHPVWSALVARFISPESRPYAYRNVHNAFLLLGAWLAVIWLYLLLGTTRLTLSQQGIVLVLLSGVGIALGRLLERVPGAVGWPVYGAGWLMWLIGLIQVFFTPTEALIAVVLGLAVSVEALNRSREVAWLPVLVLQLLFTALQMIWLLGLPGHNVLLAVAVALGAVGVWYDRAQGWTAGRITAAMGGAVAALVWLIYRDLGASLLLSFFIVAVLFRYRQVVYLLPLYGVWAAWAAESLRVDWPAYWPWVLAAGLVQLGAGGVLVWWGRPRRFRTLRRLYFAPLDWASLPLWFGALCTALGLWLAFWDANRMSDLTPALLLVAGSAALGALGLRTKTLASLSVMAASVALVVWLSLVALRPLDDLSSEMLFISNACAAAALGFQVVCRRALRQRRPFAPMRALVWWIGPLLGASVFLGLVSFAVLFSFVMLSAVYATSAAAWLLNSALLALASGVFAAYTRRYVWIAFGLGWLTWLLVLHPFRLEGGLWYLLPLGVFLLVYKRREWLGVGVLVACGTADIYAARFFSAPVFLFGAVMAGVVVYGYWTGRRVPFVAALAFGALGMLRYVLMLNVWLVPLAAGLVLLCAALVLEVKIDKVERWILNWMARWREWQ